MNRSCSRTRPTTGSASLKLLSLLAICGSAQTVSADPILQTHSTSLTSYVYTGSSRVQGVRPLAVQRGVYLDGSFRAGSALGWAMAGNPYEALIRHEKLGDIELATGSYSPLAADIVLPAQVSWPIRRSYSQVQETSSPAHLDSDGYQGRNWFQASQPELQLYDADSNPGTKGDADILYLIYGADRYIEFDRTAANADTFRAVNGAAGVIELEAGSPDVYVYYDQQGNRTYFFGDDTASNVADWQLWKVVDPAGNTAYVGDKTTAATAVTNGYNADGTIGVAYDSTSNGGRRFTYDYDTIDSVSRLIEVKVEVQDNGAGWGSPTNVEEIARVTYGYYHSGDNTHGPNGTLKLVTVRKILSPADNDLDTGIYEERQTYYRYYTQSWADSEGRRGGIGMLKMVVDAEGCRGFDWGEGGAESPEVLDNGFEGATDAALEAYSSAYLEYASGSDYRVWKAFFSGECGCSGSSNGTHTFTYGTNGSFSPVSGYDTEWKSRTVIQQPDSIYKTLYFDEVGQQLSSVITDGNPAVSYTDMWATEVERNADGQVTAIYTPAANDNDYDHSDGSFTRKASAGLVRIYERDATGGAATLGFIKGTLFKEGTGGTAYYESWQEYDVAAELEVASGVTVIRPVIDEMRRYHTAGASAGTSANYDATTMTYDWWSNTDTSVEFIAMKSVTTTSPYLDDAKNGPDATTATSRYFRKDGTTVFTVDARGYVSNVQMVNGQVSRSIVDANIDSPALPYPDDEDPDSDFGIASSGTGNERTTDMEYDSLGRSTLTFHPDETDTQAYYSRLLDGRLVTISIPRVEIDEVVEEEEDPDPTVYHGPAFYTVTNLAGKPTFSGTIAISGGITTALSSWIDETDSDPILALGVGTLARMSTSIYNESSGQLLESRSYFDIPGSGAGSDGTNYDATFYAYDDMGRTIRVLQPHGTISRTAYDDLGRGYQQFTGTNDNGLPGGSMSGTSNMVKVSQATFDGGGDGGNSHLTKRTAFVEDSTTDMRETSFLHDVRGRTIVTLNPQAPHTLVAYDNLGRAIEVGQYSSTSGLDISDVPSILATNRMAMSKTYYNEKGQVWKTARHKIDPADGSDDDSLDSLTWYDPDGRVIKAEGEQITKIFYDRLGRATHSFILGSTNDSGYTDADDVSGDLVLEERQTTYESGLSDNVVMSAVIQRHHTDYGLSENLGALDTNADSGNQFKYTAANLKGRIQIASMWYDDLDRMIETVQYGTNGGSDFDRKPSGSFLTVPSRSPTELRTTYGYNDDGTLRDVTDPRAKSTRTLYDDLGRTIATIQNYVNGTPSGVTGDDDLYTRFSYVDGLQTRMWVDLDGDDTVDGDDQVTTYIYGAVKGTPSQSKVASGHTLRAILYPDTTNTGTDHLDINSDSDDVESFAYNAQGQPTLKKDQIGNTFDMVYDTAGRLLHRRVTNLDGSFDSAVKRISTAYDALGRVQTVTQHTHETVGSGTVVDEVKYTYEGWGMLDLFEQDRNSAVGAGGSVDDYEVNHDYDDRTGGRNTIIRTQTTYPDGVVVAMEEIDNAFSIGDDAEQARTLRMEVGGTTVAQYAYLGAGTLVGTDLLQPDVFSNRYTSGPTYGQLDRFNRPVGWTWTKDLSTDVNFYDLAIAYDENGNITRTEDNIHTAGAAGSGNGLFDALYTMDGVNRLLRAKEGHWDGSTVTDGNAKRDEVWTLEQTGNWEFFKRDLDGDLDYTDTNELKDRRTHNVVNELLTRDTDDNSSVNYTFTYDDNGNMTDDGQRYTYKWDAFGRLKEVRNRSNSALVAEYKYNGLGYRIGWHYDTDADGTVENNTDDPWYLFVYDERWRILNTYRLLDWGYNASNPAASYAKERFVYHNAGLGGRGGSSYIDSVMLRDRDGDTAWNAASDGTMEERVYYAQNWRHDVSALITSTGQMVEWVKYSSYGLPWSLPAGDTDSDGDFDATDASAIAGTYDVRKDVNLDGGVDIDDFLDAFDLNNGYVNQGWSKLGLTKWGNRKGYAGYEGDTALAGTKWHVRYRPLDSEIGRWLRREAEYLSTVATLLAYNDSNALYGTDPTGLITQACVPGQNDLQWQIGNLIPGHGESISDAYSYTSPDNNDEFIHKWKMTVYNTKVVVDTSAYIRRRPPWAGSRTIGLTPTPATIFYNCTSNGTPVTGGRTSGSTARMGLSLQWQAVFTIPPTAPQVIITTIAFGAAYSPLGFTDFEFDLGTLKFRYAQAVHQNSGTGQCVHECVCCRWHDEAVDMIKGTCDSPANDPQPPAPDDPGTPPPPEYFDPTPIYG